MKIFFTHPFYLFFLLNLPIIIITYFLTLKMRRKNALKLANFDAIARVKDIEIYSRPILPLILFIIITISLCFSLAGMSISYSSERSLFSYVIAVDSSKSMEAKDFLPSRLEVAKSEARNFISNLPTNTKLGVISFSGNSVIQQSLTDDIILVSQAIDSIDFSNVGGTDIEDAVVTSATLLDGQDKKALVLLSDGQLNVGTLDNAISYAREKELIVHTIAIGTIEGGVTSYGISKVDSDALKALAYNTNGKYFLVDSEETLSARLTEIAEVKEGTINLDLSNELIIFVIILILITFFLINTRFISYP